MENSLPFGTVNIHFALCIWCFPNKTRFLIMMLSISRPVSQSQNKTISPSVMLVHDADCVLNINESLSLSVLSVFALSQISEEDLIQNPQFCKLLVTLSQHVDRTGLTQHLRRDREKVRAHKLMHILYPPTLECVLATPSHGKINIYIFFIL